MIVGVTEALSVIILPIEKAFCAFPMISHIISWIRLYKACELHSLSYSERTLAGISDNSKGAFTKEIDNS